MSDRPSVFIGGVFDYSPSRRIVACPTDNPYSDIHCGLVRPFTQSTNCCLSDRQSVLTDGLFDHSPSRRIVACPTDNPYSLTACSTIHSVDDLLLVRPTIYIQTACPTIHSVDDLLLVRPTIYIQTARQPATHSQRNIQPQTATKSHRQSQCHRFYIGLRVLLVRIRQVLTSFNALAN